MNKFLKAFVLGTLTMSLVLSGCGKNGKNEPVEEPQEKQETQSSAEADYNQVYKPLLDKFYAMILNPDNVDTDEKGATGIVEATMAIGSAALDTIGYAIMDINNDGIKELLVGISNDNEYAFSANELKAVYTCKDNKPIFLCEGWARNDYMLIENGDFFHSGSSGAAYSNIGLFSLDKNGDSLVCKEYYFTDFEDAEKNKLAVFTNTTGEADVSKSKKTDIDVDNLFEMEKEYAKKSVHIDFEKFSGLKNAPANAEKEEKPAEKKPEKTVSRAKVDVDFAIDGLSESDKYDKIAVSSGNSATDFVVSTNSKVADFKVLELSYVGVEDGKTKYDYEVVYEQKELSPDKKLVVTMTVPETYAHYGISYVDSDGVEIKSAILVSGMDGSVVLDTI